MDVKIEIKVQNDQNGMIEAAFAKALFDRGMQSGKNAGRYILDVKVNNALVDMPGNPFKFVRITLDSKLTDNDTVILPWSCATREGHRTYEEAEHRAYSVAAKKIDAEYGELLEKLRAEGKL